MSQQPATSPLGPNATIGADDGKSQSTSGDGTPLAGASPTGIPGYEILAEIGRGGMGVVYKARHIHLNRVVAIKMILAGSHAGPVELVRFRQEAELVARFQHPNIVQTYEVGAHAGHSYLALEFVDGGNLAQRTAGAPQPPRDAARLVELLARAVDSAHQQGVIHRDLTPSNVLLTAEGAPKLTDFGLARRVGETHGMTATGAILGTPGYLAPEQIAAGKAEITPATDVYGLGAILYYLLTGRPPFQSANLIESIRQTESQAPARPSQLRSQVPRDLDTICLKCLQKSSVKRYTSAAALADDLHRFLAGEPILARPVTVSERAWLWAKRNPAIASLVSTVGVLLAVVAVGGIVLSLQLASALDQSKKDQKQAETDRDRALTATRDGEKKLLQAYLAEAKASRNSQQTGQRFATLDVVRKAATLARELNQPPAVFDELRNQAIASLALPDFQPTPEWIVLPDAPAWRTANSAVVADARLTRFASVNNLGEISIRKIGNTPDVSEEIASSPDTRGGSVSWSGDGRHFAYREWVRGRLRVWSFGAEKPMIVIDEPSGCLSCSFTPDGLKLVTVARDGIVRIRDLNDPADHRDVPLAAPAKKVLVVRETDGSVHPRDPILVLGCVLGPLFIDLNNGSAAFQLPLKRPATTVVWHPNGELLAMVTSEGIEIWDVPKKRLAGKIDATRDVGGTRLAFDSSGDILMTCGWSGRIRLWNPYTCREIISTTGQAVTIGERDRVAAFFPGRDTPGSGPLIQIALSREYRTFVTGRDNPIGGVTRAHLHPDGRLLAVGSEYGISLIDAAAGCERAFLKDVGRIAVFEPSGSLMTVGPNALFRWPVKVDPEDAEKIHIGPPERIAIPGRLDHLVVSADGQTLATSAGNGAFVWRRDRPDRAIHLKPHDDCRALAISPDGSLVATAGFNLRGLKIWKSETGELVRHLMQDNTHIWPSFSADGSVLFDRSGQCWQTADWSARPPNPAGDVVCAPANLRLAASGGRKGFVPLFDPTTGREWARLNDPNQDAISVLSMSRDGTLLFGSSTDHLCVRVWDLRLIRERLAELGLDWDAPPFPPATPVAMNRPLQIIVEQ